ncbi:MAG: hypothetical protein AAF170_15035 [Bacteroidota bacterium]
MAESPRPALATPVPKAPAAGAVIAQDAATFEWVAPPGASTFDLRIASASAPEETILELTDLPTTETTLAFDLPAGDLLWWARQSGGAWSAATAFHAGTLAEVEVAQKVEAEVAVEQRAAERSTGIIPVTTSPPPAPVWPHEQGEALDGAPTPAWSQVPGFTTPARADLELAPLGAPRLTSPLGGEVVDAVSVSLEWSEVPGATSYEVELSPNVDFSRDVMTIDAGLATEIGLSGLVPALGWKLLWRVRARVGSRATPWSLYGRFYPAGGDRADRFRTALDDARSARRRQLDYARMVREREMDLIPNHEREDAITATGTYLGVLGVAATMLAILGIAFVYTMWRALMM